MSKTQYDQKNKFRDSLFSEKAAIVMITFGVVIVVCSIIIFIWRGSFEYNIKFLIDEAKIGQFGDFIGGFVGSIFSLVGILLFYIALREQRKDFATSQETLKVQLEAFQQQVKEFEAQKFELIETRKIYEQQNKTMKIQQFDSNFYSLLNVFIQQRNSLSSEGASEFFSQLYQTIEQQIKIEGEYFSDIFIDACKKYIDIYNNNRAKLALYFMTLYRLFKVIENSDNLTDNEKVGYHKIVRSLITKEELVFLYYNYQSTFGKKPLPIVVKYNYLKHLERLDKLEFNIFKFDQTQTINLNIIADSLFSLITTNFNQAQDLAQTSEVREEINLFNIIIGIYIEDSFEIKIIVPLNVNEVIGIQLNDFLYFIECLSIDIIYHSNFKSFSKDNLVNQH